MTIPSAFKQKLEAALENVGLASGDIILVHSDARGLMALLGAESWTETLDFLLSGFEGMLGSQGTLVVPTCNDEFCRGRAYDHQRTPSQAGLFSNHVRRDRRALRSFHPIYSFAAVGPAASRVCLDVSRSAFGKGSVFERLHDANAKLVFLNTSIEGCPFIHFVEQQINVDYRYLKYFTGRVRHTGLAYVDTFDAFVPYLDRGIETQLAPLGDKLETLGLMHRADFGDTTILQVGCQDFVALARQAWLEDPYAFLARPPARPIDDQPRCLRRPATATIRSAQFSPKQFVSQLHPLHRTLVSDGTDQALDLIGQQLPSAVDYRVEVYPPTKRVWTWRVPERYIVDEAYLETEDGQRIVDFRDHPLHVVSYSVAVDRWLSWHELAPHLYVSERRPGAIPWVFKYYERDWGFCLSQEQYARLPRESRYRAVIRSRFSAEPDEGLRVGIATLPADENDTPPTREMLILAHVCHPGQSNDDAAGVAVCVELLRRLAARPLPSGAMRLRFLFGPETIGTVCYMAHHESQLSQIVGGLFLEMTGNRNSLVLQRTRQDRHDLDRIALDVLNRRGQPFRQGAFRDVIRNDEMVVNGPGVNIPCLSLSRWPYDEYHTSDDRPELIDEAMLLEAADVAEAIIRTFATNYLPVRTFRGPIFLSGYGLHVDQRIDRELNRAVEKIMLRLEGEDSLFDIAEAVSLDYWAVWEFVEKLRARGLVRAAYSPAQPGPAMAAAYPVPGLDDRQDISGRPV